MRGREEEKKTPRKAQRNKGKEAREGKGGKRQRRLSDSGKQQRQHGSRWLARHCSLPALYFFLPLLLLLLLSSSCPSLPLSSVRSRLHTVGFIVFELDALRSFVLFRAPLEGLIAAHTRSPFVSFFCHLFSATPLHSRSLSLSFSLWSSASTITTTAITSSSSLPSFSFSRLFFARYTPTETPTTTR